MIDYKTRHDAGVGAAIRVMNAALQEAAHEALKAMRHVDPTMDSNHPRLGIALRHAVYDSVSPESIAMAVDIARMADQAKVVQISDGQAIPPTANECDECLPKPRAWPQTYRRDE